MLGISYILLYNIFKKKYLYKKKKKKNQNNFIHAQYYDLLFVALRNYAQ